VCVWNKLDHVQTICTCNGRTTQKHNAAHLPLSVRFPRATRASTSVPRSPYLSSSCIASKSSGTRSRHSCRTHDRFTILLYTHTSHLFHVVFLTTYSSRLSLSLCTVVFSISWFTFLLLCLTFCNQLLVHICYMFLPIYGLLLLLLCSI